MGWNRMDQTSTRKGIVRAKEQIDCLFRDLSSDMTILYVHGGGFKSVR